MGDSPTLTALLQEQASLTARIAEERKAQEERKIVQERWDNRNKPISDQALTELVRQTGIEPLTRSCWLNVYFHDELGGCSISVSRNADPDSCFISERVFNTIFNHLKDCGAYMDKEPVYTDKSPQYWRGKFSSGTIYISIENLEKELKIGKCLEQPSRELGE